MKIENSVVLITGANRGIGLAFARALLARGARKVYAAARNPESVTLPGVEALQLDVTKPEQIAAAVNQASDVTLVINNAGIAQPGGFLAQDGDAVARRIFETNFFGVLNMSKAFAPVLKANGGGALLNVLSVASWVNGGELAAYSASKSAAWSLTNALRYELAEQKTQVLGLHMAYVDTDLTRGFDVPKSSAEEIVQRALDGLEAGTDEVLADVLTQQIRQGLTATRPIYLPPVQMSTDQPELPSRNQLIPKVKTDSIQQLMRTAVLGFTMAAAFSSAPVSAAEVVSTGTPQNLPTAIQALRDSWKSVATQTITAEGVSFAYRELGKQNGGTPVIFLVHLAAVLDNWDPRIVDGIAAKHHVIAFDNRGIGASSGSPSNSMEQMADDAVTFIKAMGFKQVDLLGFSMGGMIAQEIVLKEPQLVRKMILAGTGPAGGEGISSVAGVTIYDMLRGFFTCQDAKQFLFFTRTAGGIGAGKAFLERLKERTENRDKEISVSAFLAQLEALRTWGQKVPADLSVVTQPVLVVNGDADRMVPTPNTHDLARRLPNSSLIIYPDAGHGGIFQFHADFVPSALEFLGR